MMVKNLSNPNTKLKFQNVIYKDRIKELAFRNDAFNKELERARFHQKQMEERLLQAGKMYVMGQLAGGIAHDFNNILTSILGHAEFARTFQLADDDPAKKSIEKIITASNRAAAMIKRILSFGSQKEIDSANIAIHPIVMEVINLIRVSIPKTIDIKLNLSATSDTIIGDPSMIHQVLMNLSINAAYAMRLTGGRMDVITEDFENTSNECPDLKPKSYIKILVKDTGDGMPDLVKNRILEPFFSTKQSNEGTGLGLFVVHNIVKSLQGCISVESELGKGSCFYVMFPKTTEKSTLKN